MFCVYVQNIKACSLDTVQFATTRSEATVESDGASIMMPYRYEETRKRKTAYGRIKEMFVHSMWPGGPKLVVIQCAWHEEAGTNPVSKLPQIRLNQLWNHRMHFIKDCWAQNCALFPSDPFSDGELYDVLGHRD